MWEEGNGADIHVGNGTTACNNACMHMEAATEHWGHRRSNGVWMISILSYLSYSILYISLVVYSTILCFGMDTPAFLSFPFLCFPFFSFLSFLFFLFFGTVASHSLTHSECSISLIIQ